MLDVGQLCVKTAGREAGKICCIVKKVDMNFVLVTGPQEITRVKRRKCNILHLEPLTEKVKIASDASDESVMKAYQTSDVYKKLGLHLPSKEELKQLQDLKTVKEKAKKEREEKAKKEQEAAERKKKEEERKAKEKAQKEKKAAAEKKATPPKEEKPAEKTPVTTPEAKPDTTPAPPKEIPPGEEPGKK